MSAMESTPRSTLITMEPRDPEDSRENNVVHSTSVHTPSQAHLDWFVSGALECFSYIRRRAVMLGGLIRGFDWMHGRMDGRLLQIIFMTLSGLLLLFPFEQIIAQFILLGTDWKYWSIKTFVTISYFVFYLVDRLLLLYAGVAKGIPRAIQIVFLGMDAIIKDNNEVTMGNITKIFLLIGGICLGIGMSVFTAWFPENSVGGAERINITASTINFNLTMQTTLSDAMTLQGIFSGFLETSKCLNFIFQFVSIGVSILVFANVVQKNVNQTVPSSAEQNDACKNLLKACEKYTEFARVWIRVYFWILWGFDKLLESFPDRQGALGLPGVRYCLGILAMFLTVGFMNCSK